MAPTIEQLEAMTDAEVRLHTTREPRTIFERSTIVPADESFLSTFFESASEELVRDAYARAGIPFKRISTTISEEEGSR